MTADKLNHECQLLQDWIKRRKAQRQGTGDLLGRLKALRTKQLNAELRLERKAGRVS